MKISTKISIAFNILFVSYLIFNETQITKKHEIFRENKISNKSLGYLTSLNSGIEFYNKGIFFDCGDGEISSILDSSGNEIVPPGAKLIAVRKKYTIGTFSGDITINQDNTNTIKLIFLQ